MTIKMQMMNKVWLFILVFSCSSLNIYSGSAKKVHLRVGISVLEPFVILNKEQNPEGFTIDLWKSVITQKPLNYQFIICFAFFTAELTSTFTIQQFQTKIKGTENLVGLRVGTIEGSTSVQEIIKCRRIPKYYSNIISLCNDNIHFSGVTLPC